MLMQFVVEDLVSQLCTFASRVRNDTHSRGLGNSQVATTINTMSLTLIKLWQGFQASNLGWYKGERSLCGERCL